MPDDQFGVPEEEEEGEPTGVGGLPTTIEELLQMLLANLPKDQWGNLITIRGPVSAQGLAQSLLSQQGRLWFTKLKSGEAMDWEPALQDILAGDLSKLPFKLPRMRTGYETTVGEYEGRISDKGFVKKFLASAGAESIYDLPDWQQRQLADATRRQYEGETGYRTARPSWEPEVTYAGFRQYEGGYGYAGQREAEEALATEEFQRVADKANRGMPLTTQETQLLNRGRPSYEIAPKTAFGKGGMQPLLPALLQEEGIRHFYRRAKELGIDTTGLEMSQYQPGVTDPLETGAHIGLALSVRREEERLRTEKSKRLGADFPEFAGRYQAHMAPTEQEIYRPEPLAGFEQWAETLPEFKEARQKREREMVGKYPAAWQAYGEVGGPMGWEEWTAQEPAAQMYVKAQELKFTQARQRAQARIAPRAQWRAYA